MDKISVKNVRIRHSIAQDEPSGSGEGLPYPFKRAPHPFLCRLKETAAFTVNAPDALIAAGFASMGMGFFTLFRPTPVLLFILTSHLRNTPRLHPINRNLLFITTFSWEGVLFFVLFVLGFVLTFSVKIKKRAVLLLHPWALMLLYFDSIVWLTLALYLHLMILKNSSLDYSFDHISDPIVIFTVIYVDCIIFFMVHYLYATYFITAELTVIEMCY